LAILSGSNSSICTLSPFPKYLTAVAMT
jgi:hypothetical protein